ncbi:hypothetical protein ER308_09330 [Egibacter rhizosphaerae]|uniref:Uncharacterized protein n=1 Tax=Egibacter rhizosphaerae TaxID=1670831 RepID=A0A411YEW9_9ACTN|nr:hypothetical protein [Egibacter rhizosphaerae]QBI19731.1 hypothetical protein ER308_09330 [Egibacter rhizosphaerae]
MLQGRGDTMVHRATRDVSSPRLAGASLWYGAAGVLVALAFVGNLLVEFEVALVAASLMISPGVTLGAVAFLVAQLLLLWRLRPVSAAAPVGLGLAALGVAAAVVWSVLAVAAYADTALPGLRASAAGGLALLALFGSVVVAGGVLSRLEGPTRRAAVGLWAIVLLVVAAGAATWLGVPADWAITALYGTLAAALATTAHRLR